jgi:transcriptional regulator with XRE-family HTH domain
LNSPGATPIHYGRALPEAKRMRKEAGTWLKGLRQAAGLSQIELAKRLGFKYYTFISQIENGFGRVPSESMRAWAENLGVRPSEFARRLLSYYDPDLHQLLTEEDQSREDRK